MLAPGGAPCLSPRTMPGCTCPLYSVAVEQPAEGGMARSSASARQPSRNCRSTSGWNFAVDESSIQPDRSPLGWRSARCTPPRSWRTRRLWASSFGNILFLDYGEKRERGQEEKTHQGPVLDVGCIWVTELRKNSPAGKSGKVRSVDEISR